eukprot:873480-Pelagomonas_calceolata.AAC.11
MVAADKEGLGECPSWGTDAQPQVMTDGRPGWPSRIPCLICRQSAHDAEAVPRSKHAHKRAKQSSSRMRA